MTAGAERDLAAALGTQYEILRRLGEGGMGTVYLARERLLDRRVAIKVLRPELVHGDARERFVREARTAARLTHPNIVPLYSFGQTDDTLFYVMGYVEGESLEARLARTPRPGHEETRRVLAEVADALDYAHRCGVVHRDIKPDNVLIEGESGRAVLTDFGIAKMQTARSTLTRTGILVGTPLYMSPEQASGDRELDGRSDLYSLGVIGYRMIAGRVPFDGQSMQEVLAQHVMRAPPPLETVQPDVPHDLAWAVMRCLEKEPSRRWAAAGALRHSLLSAEETGVGLPEEIERVPSRGVGVALVVWAAEIICLSAFAAGFGSMALLAAGALPFVGIASLLPTVAAVRRVGLSSARAWRLLFATPADWTGWWPQSLRRSSDIWSTLPAEIRRLRIVRSAVFLAAIGVGAPAAAILGIRALVFGDRGAALGSVAALAVAVASTWLAHAWTIQRAAAWLRSQRVPGAIAAKLITESTLRSKFWRRPEVLPLLHGRAVESGIDELADDTYCTTTPTHLGMFDHIDPRSPTPLYAQIAGRIRVAIAAGELRPGEGLPSVRQLASRLRINPATVVQAYRELEGEGLVSTRHGAGTFVQDIAPDRRSQHRADEARRLVRDLLVHAGTLGISADDLRVAVNEVLNGRKS